MLAVLCALGSSLMYAMASVLQQHGAAEQPEEQSMKLGLLVRLVQNRAWLVGTACDVAGYVLQFVALGHGPIIIVQPMLVLGLLFALPIGAAWAGRRLNRADWFGSVLVCAGLATFLSVANPADGRNNAHRLAWIAMLLSVTALTGALCLWGRHASLRRRAILLSAGAGIVYGAAAALTKTSSHLLSRGVLPLLTHWQPYVLVVFGVGGMLLGQSAFQAGALDLSLPTMTVADPIVSIAIGAFMLRESISSSPLAVGAEVASLLAMSAGIYLLARREKEAIEPARTAPGATEYS